MKATVAAVALAIVTVVLGLGLFFGPAEARAYCPLGEPCPVASALDTP